MIRAVIFDLDGTLVDHVGAAKAALLEGLARLRLAPEPGEADPVLALWQQLERRHMDEFLAGECTFAEQRRRRLLTFLPALGADAPRVATNESWWQHYSLDYEAHWTTYPDVIPCLDQLTARMPPLRLGVLTNGDGVQQRAKLERFGLLDRFDGIFVSSEIGAAKPAPASFHIAREGLSVAAGHALFVGDMLELDALAAAAAGLVGVWLDRADGDLRPPVRRITSLAELPDLVN